MNRDFPLCLQQFWCCYLTQYSGITIETDDVITTTDDVITTTDDVIHIICIDLEGKLMCCLFLGRKNSPFQIYFLELYMEILRQKLLNNNKIYVVGQSFFMSKNYFIKNRFLATYNLAKWQATKEFVLTIPVGHVAKVFTTLLYFHHPHAPEWWNLFHKHANKFSQTFCKPPCDWLINRGWWKFTTLWQFHHPTKPGEFHHP